MSHFTSPTQQNTSDVIQQVPTSISYSIYFYWARQRPSSSCSQSERRAYHPSNDNNRASAHITHASDAQRPKVCMFSVHTTEETVYTACIHSINMEHTVYAAYIRYGSITNTLYTSLIYIPSWNTLYMPLTYVTVQ